MKFHLVLVFDIGQSPWRIHAAPRLPPWPQSLPGHGLQWQDALHFQVLASGSCSSHQGQSSHHAYVSKEVLPCLGFFHPPGEMSCVVLMDGGGPLGLR